MIHGVRVEHGAAKWYRNRWVRTDSFVADFPLYNSDGSRNLRAATSNTHVVNHAGKTLALVESSLPYEITNELETVGAYDFGGKLADAMTAHPQDLPDHRRTAFLRIWQHLRPPARHLSPRRRQRRAHRQPTRRGEGADDDARLRDDRRAHRLPGPAHRLRHEYRDRCRTRYALPLERLLRGGPVGGVLRRSDPFGDIRWFEIDPCYVFHVANAHDEGDSIVLQAVRYPELWRRASDFDVEGVLWEWRIDLAAGAVRERQLDDSGVEFPRIDDRLAGLPARYTVAVGENSWLRYDLSGGTAVRHDLGTGGAGGGGVRAGPRPRRRKQRLVPRLRLRPGARRQ